jgi:hypothetical protein
MQLICIEGRGKSFLSCLDNKCINTNPCFSMGIGMSAFSGFSPDPIQSGLRPKIIVSVCLQPEGWG